MLRQDVWCFSRFKTRGFGAAVALTIGLYCLGPCFALAQHISAKTNTHNVEIPDLLLSEAGIRPQAVRMYRQAVRELHSRDIAAAEKDARRAVSLDAKFADADALAATAALAERQFTRARTEASDAVHIDVNDEKAWVILATADNYLGKYADAVDALSHVRQKDQTTWQVAYQWARAEAGQDNTTKTLEWVNRAALTAPPGFAPLHLLRASAMEATNQFSQAARELEIYLQLSGENAPERQELTRELYRLRELAQEEGTSMPGAEGMPAYNALAN
jgi:hypothetical protein